MHRSKFQEAYGKTWPGRMYSKEAIDNAAKITDSKVKFCKMPEVKVDLTDRANLALQAATPLPVINKAEIIESPLIKAARGGTWHDPSTWEGGVILLMQTGVLFFYLALYERRSCEILVVYL